MDETWAHCYTPETKQQFKSGGSRWCSSKESEIDLISRKGHGQRVLGSEEELFDTPDRRAQGLREIKDLVKNDEHTKNIEFEDDFLLQYLRVRNYINTPLRCQDGCVILLVELDNWILRSFQWRRSKELMLYLLESLRIL
ncbi:hypothetical protein CEXT_702271 [Caerostris extrusa]|uniref:Uncharacterized protein n=1 Tax=Caerostris extrusa TaxID=172846 RepID=A0AAV4WFI3_CAEEX|nr:hypothetical protein CEXT_702271 [Caerostris extrusa]